MKIAIHSINRIRSITRYLTWTNPIHKWKIGKGVCPSCKGKVFVALREDPFMTRCLKCLANITNLSLIPVIKKHKITHQVNNCWEMSTYGATLNYLKNTFPNVIESEYFQNKQPGKIINGVLNQDVQNLTFKDSSLDLITSNQVFEHVPNDLAGYAECYRTLRKGGALIFTVPLYDSPQTQMLVELKNGDMIFHSEPEYHDSRLEGPKSALVFWRHSKHDICNRVAQFGFKTSIEEIFLTEKQGTPSLVVYAQKI